MGLHGVWMDGKTTSYACGEPVGSSSNTSSTPSDRVDYVNSSPSSSK